MFLVKQEVTISLVALTAVALLAFGCSSNPVNPDPDPVVKAPAMGEATTTWDATNEFWATVINATDYEATAHYSFGVKGAVKPTDPSTSTEWTLGLRRSNITLNSGVSGPGVITAFNVTGSENAKAFGDLTLADVPATTEFEADKYGYVVDSWSDYDFVNHILIMTGNVYTLLDAGGNNYIKFKVDSLVGAAQPPSMGLIYISYVYQATADSPDLSGDVQQAVLDGSSGLVYFDFSSGSSASPTDPANSSDWDLRFSAYNIELNNEVFGPGAVKAYGAYADLNDPTSIEELTTAETEPNAYFADQFASVLSDWFDYNPDLHQLASKGDVYIIFDGTDYFAFEIRSYYTEVEGSPEAAMFQVNWAQLQ